MKNRFPFEINLASYDLRRSRRLRLGLWALIFVLLASGLIQVRLYLSQQEGYREVQDQLQRLSQRESRMEAELRAMGLDTSAGGLEAFRQLVGGLNGFIAQKGFSWTAFLNELETAIPSNISVSQIQPRMPDGVISLTGKGLTLKDLTRLMIQLEESPSFQDVFLSQQRVDQEGFIDFAIEFQYRPDGRVAGG